MRGARRGGQPLGATRARMSPPFGRSGEHKRAQLRLRPGIELPGMWNRGWGKRCGNGKVWPSNRSRRRKGGGTPFHLLYGSEGSALEQALASGDRHAGCGVLWLTVAFTRTSAPKSAPAPAASSRWAPGLSHRRAHRPPPQEDSSAHMAPAAARFFMSDMIDESN